MAGIPSTVKRRFRGNLHKFASFTALLFALSATTQAQTQSQTLTPDQRLLREIYQELIEIDTTDSAGDTTRAARAMAARLKSGGFLDADMQIIVPPEAPRKGNLVARLKGTGRHRPLLLLAHLDVVEARRNDWARDPFRLIEENGYFYARGSIDDKAMASIFVANLIRMKQERFLPDRDLIVALTADEEIIPSRYNGLEYLLRTHRDLIDAEMALNEGGAGLINKEGRYLYLSVQAGEKVFQTYQLEVRSPGGHSSLPSKDNAIYHLAGGLSRLAKFDFPLRLSGPVRIYFERVSKFESGQVADDMGAILREPPDPAAVARLSDIPRYNAQLRTTCVATMLEAGHAMNALPQRARAIVNCRLLPGDSVEEVRRTLVRVLADERIEITPLGEAVISPPAPLTPQLLEPVERVSAQMWPGVPVIPTLAAAATDGRFLNNAGIPTYGISGLFRDIEGDGVHGLDERVRVKSLYESLEFLYRLIKALSS